LKSVLTMSRSSYYRRSSR